MKYILEQDLKKISGGTAVQVAGFSFDADSVNAVCANKLANWYKSQLEADGHVYLVREGKWGNQTGKIVGAKECKWYDQYVFDYYMQKAIPNAWIVE